MLNSILIVLPTLAVLLGLLPRQATAETWQEKLSESRQRTAAKVVGLDAFVADAMCRVESKWGLRVRLAGDGQVAGDADPEAFEYAANERPSSTFAIHIVRKGDREQIEIDRVLAAREHQSYEFATSGAWLIKPNEKIWKIDRTQEVVLQDAESLWAAEPGDPPLFSRGLTLAFALQPVGWVPPKMLSAVNAGSAAMTVSTDITGNASAPVVKDEVRITLNGSDAAPRLITRRTQYELRGDTYLPVHVSFHSDSYPAWNVWEFHWAEKQPDDKPDPVAALLGVRLDAADATGWLYVSTKDAVPGRRYSYTDVKFATLESRDLDGERLDAKLNTLDMPPSFELINLRSK